MVNTKNNNAVTGLPVGSAVEVSCIITNLSIQTRVDSITSNRVVRLLALIRKINLV